MKEDLLVTALLIHFLMYVHSVGNAGGGGSGGDVGAGLPDPQMYDAVYFDSDSEEEDTPGKCTI